MRPVLTVVVLLACLTPALGEADRLGGFEWAAELAPDKRAEFDDQVAHSGKYSLRYQAAATDKAPTRANLVLAETFETAEFQADAWIKLEGEGSLRLFYPGDGRNVLKVIESPTEGWQPLKLHLRANPERDPGEVYGLQLQAALRADSGQVTWWLDDVFVTPLYQHRTPKIDHPPTIDGDLSDACWNDGSYAGDPYWRMYNKPRDAKEPTDVWCCYDDERLYVAFRCVTRAPGRLVTKVIDHDGPAWRDDSAEIFFNPSHDHARYYEYIVTPTEVVFDSKWWREGGAWQVDWHYFGQWKAAVEKDAWVVEIALDLRSYEERDLQGNPTGYMELPTGDVAGILFSRNDRVLEEGMSWADCIGSFHEVYQYGHLVGFRPVCTDAYRKYALREIDRLQGRWSEMYYEAGCPVPIPVQSEEFQNGTEGLPETITALRKRAEAEKPSFDEWVAIGREVQRLETWLDRARAALAPLNVEARWQHILSSEEPGWAVAVASPMEAVRSDDERADTLREADVIRIAAARGESEPVHLVLMFRESLPCPSVQLGHRALEGPGGTITAANMRWYVLNEFSDILERRNTVPLKHPEAARLWWVVDVPRDARPGLYRGHLTVGCWDGPWSSVPVELTVHDFALPRTPSLPVSVEFDSKQVAKNWHGADAGPLNAREYWPFAEELLRHRLTPRELLADFTRWGDEGPDFSLAEEMLTRAELAGVRADALIAARPEQLAGSTHPARVLTEALLHWRRRTGADVIPTYVCEQDELSVGLRPSQLNRSVAAVGRKPPAVAGALELAGAWALSPSACVGLTEDLGPATAAAGATGKELAWRLDRGGDEETLWLFAGAGTRGLMDARMLGWLAYDYRVGRIFLDEGLSLSRLRDGEDVACGLLYTWGQMGLTPAQQGTPAPSLRLELLREGLEDYEYLHMLNQLNRRLSRIGGAQKYTRLSRENSWLLKLDYRIIKNVRSYTHDPDVVMQWRESLARQIERTRDVLRRHGEEGLPGD